MQFEFTAFARTAEGRGASRRMRRAGKAPGRGPPPSAGAAAPSSAARTQRPDASAIQR